MVQLSDSLIRRPYMHLPQFSHPISFSVSAVDAQDMFKAEDDDESEINEKLKDMSLEKH